MGINDYGWGGGRNQVMGGSLSASARPEDLAGERSVEWVVGPDALDRFAFAYRDVLASIHCLAPSSEIWCLTLCPATSPSEAERCYKYQMRGIELDAYNRAIVQAARETGAHVADMRAYDMRAYGIQYDAVDGCHPSALGMRQISDMVIARMEGSSEMPASIGDAPRAVRTCQYDAVDGCHPSALGMRQISDMVIARMEGSSEMPASIGDAPRAVRTCGRAHCHGCPMDESTDSRWTIACRGPKDGR